MNKISIIDFETQAIEPRPHYPPEPVGVAIAELRGSQVIKKRYLAWGHPIENNTTKAKAHAELASIWRDPSTELLFHNSKFDVDVADVHLDLPFPGWGRVHDTLFELYLDDPRAPSLSLKPSAERLLGMPPEEQIAVRDWLVEHGIVKRNVTGWGAHIAKAPAKLVGEYAIGDVVRTGLLHRKLHASLTQRNMIDAYARERRILPLLLDNERRGVRVHLERLERDVPMYADMLSKCDKWLRARLSATDLNIDSDQDLADALETANVVTSWEKTAKGKRSTSRKKLHLADPQIGEVLAYRGQLATALRTFLEPWLTQAKLTGGFIHTNWNQVRGESDKGTRTGRLSSSPNFQNLANEFPAYKLPFRAPPLPNVRDYVIPLADDHVLISLDYSQQELRALGHFEDGPLLDAYRRNPRMDLHDHARSLVNKMLNTSFERKPIKNLAFGLIYGMGIDKTAASMGVDVDTARLIKRTYLQIFPGLKPLIDDLYRRARLGLPIRTWGGREYYVEEPKLVEDKNTQTKIMRTFEYKMLNYLIQGSSADCTKEAMARFTELSSCGQFCFQVHDQLILSAPEKRWREAMADLRGAMESVEFDVPMLTDASVGPTWAKLEEVR